MNIELKNAKFSIEGHKGKFCIDNVLVISKMDENKCVTVVTRYKRIANKKLKESA